MSDTITRLTFPDREFVLVGTAHVSKASIDEVREVIRAEQPDAVGVEIDAGRYRSLTEPQSWQKLDIVKVLREGKGFLLMANLALSTFQKKIGQELDVQPGQEMIAAVEAANEVGARSDFIDREVQVTLRRAWRKSSFWGKNKLLGVRHEGYMVREWGTGRTVLKLKSPHYLAKKFLMRMSSLKVVQMFTDRETLLKTIDEEFYSVVHKITRYWTLEQWGALDDQARRGWIEAYFEDRQS